MNVAFHDVRRLAAVLALALALLAMVAAPRAAGAEQLRGAQVHSLWSSQTVATSDRELDMLRDAGANSVRIDLSWSSLETDGKGRYSPWYVEKTDTIFRHAAERGLKVVAVFWSTPCWASAAPDSLRQSCAGAWWDRNVDRYPPRNPSDYADAAQFVARRWGSQLAAIEVWNEPDLADQYFLHSDDPARDDAAMLRAAYPRIKAEAPGLPVLAGSLSGSDGDFLEELYRKGIGGYFDGVSIHPYNEWRDPDDAWQEQWKRWSFLRGVPWIHEIMTRHGDGAKGVWLTEFGFSTCGDGDRWCVSHAQQGEYIEDSFRIARRWDYVKAALVYNLRNKGTNPTGREDQFGMINRDFSPKPAWAAFREAMAAGGGDTAGTGSGADTGSGSGGGTIAPVLTQPGPVTVGRDGAAPVRLTCRSTGPACEGTVRLETKPIRISRHGPKRRVKIGTRRVRMLAGRTVIVRIAIPRRHRPLLRRLRNVRVRVRVTANSRERDARALTLRCSRLPAR